ncbi:hypothetical protein ACVT98_03090 [Vibrio campbellii]
MELSAVSQNEVLKVLAEKIHCHLQCEGLRISIVSECLRAVLYFYSYKSLQECNWKPIPTVRLTSKARQKLSVFWADIGNPGKRGIYPCVAQVLDGLFELGDLHKSSGGHWLIPPMHAIKCGDDKAVLLGGGPIPILPAQIADKVRVVGRVRFIEHVKIEEHVEVWQVSDWIGHNFKQLNSWAESLLKKCIGNMSDSIHDFGQNHIYLNGRWVESTAIPSDVSGHFVCRVKTKKYFSYFLGEFKNSSLNRLSSLTSQEARRLRFYIDAESNNPVVVKASYVSKEIIRLQLVRPLPIEESKVLLLGWRVPALNGEYSRAEYFEFPIEVVPVIREVFDRLKIVLALV